MDLILETIPDSCLVFSPSKQHCENLSKQIGVFLGQHSKPPDQVTAQRTEFLRGKP